VWTWRTQKRGTSHRLQLTRRTFPHRLGFYGVIDGWISNCSVVCCFIATRLASGDHGTSCQIRRQAAAQKTSIISAGKIIRATCVSGVETWRCCRCLEPGSLAPLRLKYLAAGKPVYLNPGCGSSLRAFRHGNDCRHSCRVRCSSRRQRKRIQKAQPARRWMLEADFLGSLGQT